MFDDCRHFNSDISGWDVSNVAYMTFMFRNCVRFNRDLSGWNTKNLVFKDDMFMGSGVEEKPSWCKKR